MKAARRSRATPLSLSAESETPLGEAQHSLLLNRWTLSTDSFSFISNISQKGRTLSALWGQEMLRASPLKPTRDSVPRPCKPLKRLDLNFKCLWEGHQLIGSSLGISSTASTNFSCKCRARLVERLRVLTAETLRLKRNF